ncbi:MAG: hypothetical protein WDZ30_07800 [Cellvibrionaceae bacterium]
MYEFIKISGVILSTVQELVSNPKFLSKSLTEEERASNRRFVNDYWSREKVYKRTQNIVEKAFSVKGVESPEVLDGTYQ